ncbi:hypothetical protein TRP8649_01232 [Pelagimonas phthalicica]|uniref:Outer membrane protein beta-barrel domain-containing protein n=1 Tax=Pelagimonas phthalicica TaxID=1037362 RepID=A0A238J8U2_9RHOB|nr:outer membrane beta-barrel protein [Pelagimonas phthalicica]TDS94343.1 outer membrane autotransporter protein [Pelagimonas phthalicica]SMX27130.1 hypothetical protein TRP8649_01232 [Pelagimonas phthalicica]
MLKHLSLAALAAATLSSAAYADGFYFSGSLSGTTLDHSIERDTAGTVLPVPDVGGTSFVSETDFSFGAALGYEQHFGQSDFFWGAEVFYNFENGETRNINGVLVTDIELEASYGARLIGGFDITEKFAAYAHAGVTQVDFEARNAYTFAPPKRDRNFSETGYSYGVGGTYKIDDQIALFAEYTKVDGIEFDGIAEVAGGTGRENPNTLDLSKTTFGVKFSF